MAVFRDAYDPLLMRSHSVMSPDARQALPGKSPADVAARAIAKQFCSPVAPEAEVRADERSNRELQVTVPNSNPSAIESLNQVIVSRGDVVTVLVKSGFAPKVRRARERYFSSHMPR